jgi:hypothetical protein
MEKSEGKLIAYAPQDFTLLNSVEDFESELKCQGDWSSKKSCPYSMHEYHKCPIYVKDIAFLKQILLKPEKLEEISQTPSQEFIPFRTSSQKNDRRLKEIFLKRCMPPIIREAYEFCENGGSFSLKEYCERDKDVLECSLGKTVLILTE